MAGKTNTYTDSVLNVIRGTTLTGIATVYVSLFTVTPSDTSAGTESDYGSDTRKVMAFAAPGAGTPTGRSIANSAIVSWTNWDGTSPETFVAAGIHDAVSAGNLLYWGPLDTNRTINTGETASFAIGAVVVRED